MPSASVDALIDAMLATATADLDCVGLILSGSRGAGCAGPESDYDVLLVLTDEALDERLNRSEPGQVKRDTPHGRLDLCYTSPRYLAKAAAEPGWQSPGYASARILVDKTGEVRRLLDAIATMPEEKAKADA